MNEKMIFEMAIPSQIIRYERVTEWGIQFLCRFLDLKSARKIEAGNPAFLDKAFQPLQLPIPETL